ncbi:MAG: hypothetical protein HYY90_05650 [Candidatus Omnitrophica bacterium]|nr:hypothetical protein [Candidatus Omnitrophota bacterium]
MSDVALLLRQVTLRYRNALLAKAVLVSALGVGIVWVLAGRLGAMHRASLWSVGVPGIVAIIGLASLVWWLRRHWISLRGAASHLDNALGLQQRLTTAAEFARHAPPPPLYSLLIEDTARRFSTERMRFPRLLDRTTALLAIALLLLLGWPGSAHVPLRLAQRPLTAPPTPPPPVEPPPEFPRDNQPQQQQDPSAQRGSSSERQQQPGSSETSQSSQSPQPSSPSSSSEQAGSQRQQAGQSRDQASSQEGGDQQQGGNRASHPGEEREQQRGGADHQARSQERNAQSPASTEGDSADRRGEESGTSQGRSEGDQAAHESGQRGASSPSSSQSSASLRDDVGREGSQSFGGQEAMRADIQQLLKEVSGELKALQAKLAAAEPHAQPDAGTSTDPQLYESPMKLDRATGNALPVQLQTDTAPTKTPRPGGGVGRPSGEVSDASPSVHPEEAQLSDEPREEAPTAHQPVPPEYRSVFDRLRQRDTQPTQARP